MRIILQLVYDLAVFVGKVRRLWAIGNQHGINNVTVKVEK